MPEKCYNKLCITNQYYLCGLEYQKGKLSKMNTILPSYFIFSRANSIYQEPIVNVVKYRQEIIWIIIAIAAIALFSKLHNRHLKKMSQSSIESDKSDLLTKSLDWGRAIAIVAVIFLLVFPPFSSHKYKVQNQAYNDNGFKVAKTNLLAVPVKLDYSNKPFAFDPAVNSDWVEQTKAIKRNKFVLYVNLKYPNIKMGTDDETPDYLTSNYAYYLGMMDHGKFKPAHSNTSATFANYQKYIVQHHLEDHFKKQMIFVKSKKYLTPNYKPSLVLIGDNNYTLHLKQAKKINDKLDNSEIVAN